MVPTKALGALPTLPPALWAEAERPWPAEREAQTTR